MFDFPALSAYIGALSFALLTALLLAADRGHPIGRFLIAGSLLSAIWLGIQGIYYNELAPTLGLQILVAFEALRGLAWIAFLRALLLHYHGAAFNRSINHLVAIVCSAVVATLLFAQFNGFVNATIFGGFSTNKLRILSFLSLAILGLVLLEQLIRVTRADSRWTIKHLSLGIGALFAFDFYLYADAMLFTRLDSGLWVARGIVNAFVVPLIALAAARNRDWNLSIFVSRRVVFNSAAVFGVGLYLLLMSLAGYYLNSYGGTWGSAFRAAFVSGAMIFLAVLLVSSQVRSRLRVFLAKHFYKNRYEYGEVWLSFTRKLATSDADPEQLRETILRASADIMDSTGGIMWCKTDDSHYTICSQWVLDGRSDWQLDADHPFVKKLELTQGLLEIHNATDQEPAEQFPWKDELRRAWIAVPIVHGEELLAFLVLAESRANESITFEDRNLLATVGRQAASYLAFLRATEALSEARQFEAFNQLAAFLVHDLKNVVAQLSLVVRNAEKHRDNEEFITDAFNTVGDAVTKVNRMLASLKQDMLGNHEAFDSIELNGLIDDAVKHCSERKPVPSFVRIPEPLETEANYDSLMSVVAHLIQNAQEATTTDGEVNIRAAYEGNNALIEIIDDGTGMSEEFIRTRLFKPFDTTKGKAGMGIGVYESRHIVAKLGGSLGVESVVGEGTTIRISLPCKRNLMNDEIEPSVRGATG